MRSGCSTPTGESLSSNSYLEVKISKCLDVQTVLRNRNTDNGPSASLEKAICTHGWEFVLIRNCVRALVIFLLLFFVMIIVFLFISFQRIDEFIEVICRVNSLLVATIQWYTRQLGS